VVARELESLERAVGKLLEELETMRGRVAAAEERSAGLQATLAASGVRPGESADLEGRLRELVTDNEHLKGVLEAARERAGRQRNRLIVMEDESSG
jgi:chromosome segregation ATPase